MYTFNWTGSYGSIEIMLCINEVWYSLSKEIYLILSCFASLEMVMLSSNMAIGLRRLTWISRAVTRTRSSCVWTPNGEVHGETVTPNTVKKMLAYKMNIDCRCYRSRHVGRQRGRHVRTLYKMNYIRSLYLMRKPKKFFPSAQSDGNLVSLHQYFAILPTFPTPFLFRNFV